MEPELIVIRYAEIALKGKPIRKKFEKLLIKNIKQALKQENINFKIHQEWSRIYLYSEDINKSVTVLKKIFGIKSISPVFQTNYKFDNLSNIAVKIAKQQLTPDKSFAVRASRTGDHDFTSQDIAIKIGSDIVKQTKAQVNLNHPDIKIFIEVREEKAYIFTEKIMGIGGLPLNSQGPVLALIENDNSMLAAWYLMKRGSKPIFLLVKNNSLSSKLFSFIKKWYTEQEIYQLKDNSKIFNKIKKIAEEKKCQTIITGHNLDNNADKIINKLKNLKSKTNLTVLSPLIAMEKSEINKKAKEIGLKI